MAWHYQTNKQKNTQKENGTNTHKNNLFLFLSILQALTPLDRENKQDLEVRGIR